MKVFLKSKKSDYEAVGEYNELTNELIVKKGSIVSTDIKEFKGTQSIINRRKIHVKNRKVVEDVHFKSSSTAANFITGRSKNGLDAWKDINNNSIKKVIKKR